MKHLISFSERSSWALWGTLFLVCYQNCAPFKVNTTKAQSSGAGQVVATVAVHVSADSSKPMAGVNMPDLAQNWLGSNTRSAAENRVRKALAKQIIAHAALLGATSISFSLPGYAPNSPQHLASGANDLNLWQSDPNLYWQGVDGLVAEITSHGMVFVVRHWNDLNMFTTLTQDNVTNMMTNSQSASYQLYLQYWGQFLSRYGANPNLLMIELHGELNLLMNLDLVARCKSQQTDPTACANQGNFTTDQMIAFESRVVAFFKARTSLPIVSGMGLSPAWAEHMRASPEWTGQGDFTGDTYDQFAQDFKQINAPFDLPGVHVYSSTDNDRFGLDAGNANSVTIVNDAIQIANTQMGKKLYIGEMGDQAPPSDGSWPFSQAILNLMKTGGIQYAALWVLDFYQFNLNATGGALDIELGEYPKLAQTLSLTNLNLGQSVFVPGSHEPVAAPSLLMTSPFDGDTVSTSTIVNLIAMTNLSADGQVSRIDLAIDGKVMSSLTHWPWRANLTGAQSYKGPHVLSAVAYDSLGRQTRSSVNVSFSGQ